MNKYKVTLRKAGGIKAPSLNDFTKKQIMEMLDVQKIKYTSKDKKEDLIKLLENAP